jgi:hypothetical protein
MPHPSTIPQCFANGCDSEPALCGLRAVLPSLTLWPCGGSAAQALAVRACTRSSRASRVTTPRSAASARPAWSCPPTRNCTRPTADGRPRRMASRPASTATSAGALAPSLPPQLRPWPGSSDPPLALAGARGIVPSWRPLVPSSPSVLAVGYGHAPAHTPAGFL